MASTLLRLFNYGAGSAKENFTTEALASAIREAPAPFLKALAAVGISVSEPLSRVDTQVETKSGTLDLLLQPSGQRPVLVEVKVDAGESGDQLTRYREWADQLPDGTRPHLVLLSPTWKPSDERWQWLPWQTLWDCLRDTPPYSRWKDFATWLEEVRMADNSFERVTEGESGALLDAHALLRKAVHILTPVSVHLNEVWKAAGWPLTGAHVKKQLVNRFGTWPSYSVQHTRSFRCGCAVGIYANPSGETQLSLWVWAPPKLLLERERILSIGQQRLPAWAANSASWELLRADKPLLDFEGHASASDWLKERVNELKNAGLIAVFEESGIDSESAVGELD